MPCLSLASAILLTSTVPTPFTIAPGRPDSPSNASARFASIPTPHKSPADSTALDQRMDQILALVKGEFKNSDTLFTPEFLSQVPAAQLRQLATQLVSAYGAPTGRPVVTNRPDAYTATYRVQFGDSHAIPVTLSILSQPPHRISGLLFGPPVTLARTFDDIIAQLRTKYSRLSFMVARIDSTGLVPIAAAEPTQLLAIGSAYKLYTLAEVIRRIEANQLKWTDVVSLDSADRSLPTGVLQDWPAGSPVTIHTLASLMISRSDNTAADQLFRVVGAPGVEAMQRTLGHSAPERNIPFMTSRELFALKSPKGSGIADQYVRADSATRRVLLREAASLPYADLTPFMTQTPVEIDRIEWFGSATDLARAMLWILDHTSTSATRPGREVLAINPGVIPSNQKAWVYFGFKGGSELGVLSLTFLLGRVDGRWYTVSVIINDAARLVNTGDVLPSVQRVIELLGEAGNGAIDALLYPGDRDLQAGDRAYEMVVPE